MKKTPLLFFKGTKNKKAAQEQPDKTINFDYQEFLQNDGTSFTEHHRRLHFQNLENKCKPIGKILGLDSKPSTDSNIPHGFENENRSYYQSFLHQCKKICSDKLSNLHSQSAELSAKVDNFSKRIPEFIQQEAEKMRVARELAVNKMKASFAQKRENIQEKISEVKTVILNLKNEIRELEAQLAKDYENKPMKYRKAILIGILGILTGLEAPMNFKAVLLWRDDIISTILIATLFSLLIPISAHIFGASLKSKSRSQKDIFWMFCAVCSAIGISLIIGQIRYNYLAEQNIEILSAFGYGFINFLVFLVASWVSFHFSYKNPDTVKSLVRHKDDLTESVIEHDTLQNQKNNIETDEATENQKIVELYPDDAETRVQTKLSALKNELISKEKEYSAVLTAVQSTEALICANYEEATYAFRSSNERWRNAPNPAYWEHPLPPLKTFFSEDKLHNTKSSIAGTDSPVIA